MEELYKQISDYPNYEVSNFGNVRNIFTKKVLSPKIDKGYARVCLYNPLTGRSKVLIFVHKLVMDTFNPTNNPNFIDINHIDENPLNNRLDNLEWCTHRYNINYSNVGERNSLKFSLLIVGTKVISNKQIVFRSATKAAKYLGKKVQANISKAVKENLTNKIILGYTFRLANEKEIKILNAAEYVIINN